MWCVIGLQAQTVKMFKDVVIKTSVVEDPGFSTGNVKLRPVKKNQRWIQLNVDYATASSHLKNGDVRWASDVVMKYDVLLPRVSGHPRVVLSGKVQYWAIALDGETHHAQVFIHPRMLQRYVPGLKLSKSAMNDLRVMVTFELNESPVGGGIMKKRGGKNVNVAGEIRKALSSPATKKVKDAIFNRDQTPWGIINLGYYELIKRNK
jgi:hypothetical protein